MNAKFMQAGIAAQPIYYVTLDHLYAENYMDDLNRINC